ncbi:MAG: hypothetical protein ACLF0G_09610 [Candidatus Brocadiia bacterium]
MNSARTRALPRSIRKKLDGYRRRWRLVTAHAGLLVTLGLVVGAVGAAVAADRLLRLAPTARAAALGVIGLAFAVSFGRLVLWPALRRMRDRDAAVRLGGRFPEAEEDLVSAVELSGEGRFHQGVSRSLVASALSHIVARTRGLNVRAAVPFRPVLRAGAVLAVVAGGFCAGYLLRPEAVSNALMRLFLPTRDVPFFCYTHVSVSPGDHVVRTGDVVEVEAVVGGRAVSAVRLEARNGSGPLRLELPCDDGRASWESGPLFETLDYRVRAGDAISEWYRVRVVPPPALEAVSAVLHNPSYAREPDEPQSATRVVESVQGRLEVVAGTGLELRVAAVSRGDDPEFACRGELVYGDRRLPLEPGPGGLLCSPRFAPAASGPCSLELRDGFGLRSRGPASLFLAVVPDGPPRVSVTRPARDLMVLPGERVAVEAVAEDEFGLRRLVLRRRIVESRGDEERISRWQSRVLETGGRTVRQLAGTAELVLADLGLRPGDALEYKAQASDFAGEAVMRRAYSRTYRISVLSEAEHLESVMGRLREIELALRQRASIQKTQAEDAGELAQAAQARSVAEAARHAERRERQEMRSTREVARQLERLLPELARNPSAPVSLMSELARLAQGVRSVAAGQMASAADQLGQAAQAAQGSQSAPLRNASQQAGEAGRRLEQLSRLLESLQRRGLLERLATDAERLAARQREVSDTTVPLGLQTAGTDPEELDEEQRRRLQRLSRSERSIGEGVRKLSQELRRAAGSLGFSNPLDAATAEQADSQLDAKDLGEQTEGIARDMEQNTLFRTVPRQEDVAERLEDVARTLRRGLDMDPLEAMVKELEEFIKRQTAINGDIEGATAEKAEAPGPHRLAEKQGDLGRDVAEQASALHWLAREIQGFESRTAAILDAASAEMRRGTTDLFRAALSQGLAHGEKALALLKSAREALDQESSQLASACQSCQGLEALLLLQRILLEQKRIHRDTESADETRPDQPQEFDRAVVRLARRQSEVGLDAGRLQKMIARLRAAAAMVGKAREKMDLSRMALEGGDTGRDTRVVQRQAVAILEALIQQQQGAMSGGGLAGARAMAMMQMMAGMSSGGFAGGTNAPILPASLDEAEDQEWRRSRSRFEGRLSAGSEAEYPAEFRGLLHAYFDRLRSEPQR